MARKKKRDTFGELQEKRRFQKATGAKRKRKAPKASPTARPRRGTRPARVRKLTALEEQILKEAGVQNPQRRKKKR